MPQRGIGLQPKVAELARLPWVTIRKAIQPQRGCGKGRARVKRSRHGRNRVAVGNDLRTVTQGGSCLATLGLWDGIPLEFQDSASAPIRVFAVVRFAKLARDPFLPPNLVSSSFGILLEVIISLEKMAINSSHRFLDRLVIAVVDDCLCQPAENGFDDIEILSR